MTGAMADAKDILGLSRMGSNMPSTWEKRRTNKESHKKPDGVSREVYSLIGGLPPVMPSVGINLKKHVQEPMYPDEKLGWKFVPFTSSARNDNLQLHHWDRVMLEKAAPEESDSTEAEISSTVALATKGEASKNFPCRPKYRISAGPPKDYAFAKFSRAAEIIRYTDGEYVKHLQDSNWTREETDKLFDLCEQFDLRFIIIADRFPTSRTVEELKDRYYSAAKVIFERRVSNREEVADHTLMKNVYDYEYEVHRKKTLEIVLSESRREEREAIKVLDEAQRITEERYKEKLARKEKILELKKRAQILETETPKDADLAALKKSAGAQKLVGTFPEASTRTDPRQSSASSQAIDTSPSQVRTQLIQAKLESPEASGSSAAVEQTPVSKGISAANAATEYFLEGKFPGVFLRSRVHAKMVQETSTQVGPRTARRISQMIHKYNCRPKLKYFTKRLCAAHMELRNDVHELLTLEDGLQSREAEMKILKAIHMAADKTSPSTPRRSQRATGTVAVTFSDANASSGERVSKRERRRSVRTME